MKINHVKATYHGSSDSQFVQNNSYDLVIIQALFGRLLVVPIHPATGKPLFGFKQGYHCLTELLHNWHIERSTANDHRAYGWKG
jgi:hypothetical protein